ncbi:MAG: transketolase [Clostridia bacterium]|nr:transketolase [Clostridia bacterium]
MVESRKRELSRIAYQIRRGALDAVYSAASGHPGGSLSIAEILTYLYFEEMNIDPKDPKKADRDRFVLSKGHASPGIYSTLAHRGFFPVEDLKTFRQHDSILQGHPDMKHIPGVDMTSGSLGLGISAACGMALGAKLNGYNNRVWTILGDGESEEGQVWEAAMFAAHYKLDNLCAFIDWNGLQIDGPVAEVMNPAPFEAKFEAFGWNVISIDAHNLDEIEAAVNAAKACKGKPTAIIAKSTKGKGVSYMENNVSWHGAAPKQEQYEQAVAELDAVIASLN